MSLATVVALVGVLIGYGSSAAASPSDQNSSAKQAAVAKGADPTRTDAAGIEWLCRPGQAPNPCLANETATVVPRTGASTVEKSHPAKDPSIDCFYIMPTVSTQPGVTANLKIDPSETAVAELQASRFSKDCKVYAPVYPQITRRGLVKTGTGDQSGIQQGYAVVQSAWKDYMKHYNHGRGVVVIAHSQGSVMAEELLQTQVDKNPKVRQQLVSAIIPGGNVVVPDGQKVGGTFQHLPACTRASQLHCVVAYSSFNQTPPPTSFFGIPGKGVSQLAITPSPTTGMQVLCVNPAKLVPGTGVAEPYVPSAGDKAALATGAALPSSPPPWQTTPDLYSATCMNQNGTTWLQVNGPITPGDPRPLVTPTMGPNWGLHRDDINLFLGNLVELVKHQTDAYEHGRQGV